MYVPIITSLISISFFFFEKVLIYRKSTYFSKKYFFFEKVFFFFEKVLFFRKSNYLKKKFLWKFTFLKLFDAKYILIIKILIIHSVRLCKSVNQWIRDEGKYILRYLIFVDINAKSSPSWVEIRKKGSFRYENDAEMFFFTNSLKKKNFFLNICKNNFY